MIDKALISNLTWRTLEMQREAFPGMPHFIAPDEITNLLRPTQRKGALNIHVLSLAVIAHNKNDFISFMSDLPKHATVISREENWQIGRTTPIKKAVLMFQSARKFGVAKIGGRKSADLRKANSAEGVEKIKSRWPMPSKEWPTRVLLDEAGLSLNTVKASLGKRPIAQYNYQAKLKRKANAKR